MFDTNLEMPRREFIIRSLDSHFSKHRAYCMNDNNDEKNQDITNATMLRVLR